MRRSQVAANGALLRAARSHCSAKPAPNNSANVPCDLPSANRQIPVRTQSSRPSLVWSWKCTRIIPSSANPRRTSITASRSAVGASSGQFSVFMTRAPRGPEVARRRDAVSDQDRAAGCVTPAAGVPRRAGGGYVSAPGVGGPARGRRAASFRCLMTYGGPITLAAAMSDARANASLSALLVGMFAVHALALDHSLGGDGTLRAEAVKFLGDCGGLSLARYSIVGPLFSMPLHWLDRLLGTGDALLSRYNLLLLALGVGFFVRALTRTASRRLALTFGVVLMAASTFPFAASTFYGETFSAMTVGIGLYGLAVGWRGRAWVLLVLGTCNAAPLLLPLAMVAGLRAIATKRLSPLAVPVMALAAMFLENTLRRGSPTNFGYDNDGQGPPGVLPYTGLGGFSYPLLLGIYGLLLSPGVGLLFYAPGLFLVGIDKGPDGPLRATMRLWLLFLVGTILAYAKWWCWHGMAYFGPRFLLMGSLPASLLLAWHAHRTDLSFRANLLTLVGLCFSCYVGANGAAFLFRGLRGEPAMAAADGAPCLYAPEMSALVYPFIRPSMPTPGQWPYLGLIAVALAMLALPVAVRAWRQAPAVVQRLRATWTAAGAKA